MSSPVKLVSPYPTMEDAAEVYGISSSRLRRLRKMVQTLLAGRRGKAKPVAYLSANLSAKESKTKQAPRASRRSHHAQTKKRTGSAT